MMPKRKCVSQAKHLIEMFDDGAVQKKIAEITGVPVSFMNLDGNWLGQQKNQPLSFCDLIRSKKTGHEKCLECDQTFLIKAIKSHKTTIYKCHAGLTEFIVPIKFRGEVIDFVLGGRILLREINSTAKSEFKKIADELKIDEKRLIEAAKKIPVKKKPDLINAIRTIEIITTYVCKLELEKAQERKQNERLRILYEIGEKIISTFDINKIVESVLEEGGELTGTHKATARLLNPKTNLLDPYIKKGKIGEGSEEPIRIGQGIIGAAAKDKEAILVPDVTKDSRYKCHNEDSRTELAVPMLWGKEKELVGVLNFEHTRLNAFDKNDVNLLKALANAAAIAIQNAKLIDEITKDAEKLSSDQEILIKTIYDIERSMQSDNFELISILSKIREEIVKLVKAKHGCIFSVDEKDNVLINKVFCKRVSCPKDCKGRRPDAMVYEAFRTRKIIMSPDITKDAIYSPMKKWKETVAKLVVPVTDEQGKVICILNLSSDKPNAFGPREKGLAKLFAVQSAIALKDASRILKLRERTKWLTFLFDVISDLTKESAALKEILSHIIELISKTFYVEECSIFILDEHTKKIVLEAPLKGMPKIAEKIIDYEVGKGVIGWIVENGKAIRMKDITKHENWSKKHDKHIHDAESNRKCFSFLGVPLKTADKCLGVITLKNRNQTEEHPYNWFSREDEDLLLALADVVALGIKNAQVIEEKEKISEALYREKKMAAIGTLTAGTTHGFKQPMQIIKNQVTILKGEEELEPYIEYINIIDNEIHRMHEIISVFSRFSSPKIEDDVDIKKILNQSVDQTKFPEDIKLIKKYNKISKVKCDPGQIQQVFNNLILNACESMPNGGNLEVSTCIYNRMVEIKFRDSGEGIPRFARKKIFDPFFTTKRGKGSGLGLYIGQFVVQNHGGNIRFESEEDKGAKFIVELPV